MKLKVKWNKQQFNDLEVEESDGLLQLKSLLYSLTGVPVDRQKLLAKGKTLKEDSDLTTVKDGQQLMLMGTAEVLEAPKESVTFLEDMTAEEKAEKNVSIPAGFVNLGNTCYMNSTLQCMRHMPELRSALQQVTVTNANRTLPLVFSTQLRDMWTNLDRAGKSYTPMQFVQVLRSNYPQFAQQGPQGGFMQQDAEELYNIVTQSLAGALTDTETKFDTILGLEMEETLTCTESSLEPEVKRKDQVNKLVCNIQGGPGSNVVVNHLVEGLKLGLEGTIEKRSAVLDRDALWNKKQCIAKLPKFLCIQYMRFFWKPTPESRDHTGVKCKILRPVVFTETLDIFEFTNDKLQAKLRANRAALSQANDIMKKNESDVKLSTDAVTSNETKEQTEDNPMKQARLNSEKQEEKEKKNTSQEMDVDDEEAALQAALAMSISGEAPNPPAVPTTTAPPPPGSDASSLKTSIDSSDDLLLPCKGFTGSYELAGVVTHKGRSADSGHYIAWVRQQPGSEYWWKYDDEQVSEVQTQEILNLRGGGDW
eukprot:CAMPEP_0182428190 /NCGR_PEP_ID=MMETSP1167-20130531/21376_1 /TAXON_ID=2988 /ORGANISM="Mallomonas Sp, Strain CCMP3275" /LENGTH=535 /DNA_ID=CAMNT_0024610931 /DNA_START=66 /DNA_END=1670 /DNA_ORIENTATION=+